MRKVILMATMVLMSLVANAQNAAEARKILDKTASVVGRKGGVMKDMANYCIMTVLEIQKEKEE